MSYLVGIDEAGYGPNYGPLVITATCWRVPGDPLCLDLYRELRSCVTAGGGSSIKSDERVPIADSKALYSPRTGPARLELGVLASLALVHGATDRWDQFWQELCPSDFDEMKKLPWYVGFDASLPLFVEPARVAKLSDRLSAGCLEAGIQLTSIRARAIFAPRFNELLNEHGSKALALSQLSIDLVGETLSDLADEPALVICDKHGGRNHYQSLLQNRFTEDRVEVCSEGRRQSVYAWGPSPRRIEVRFCVGAEEFLQVALASMTSKYLRELAMLAFNRYWCERVPNLRPTAGYPQDARRFKAQIRRAQTKLGIADRTLWRAR